MRSPGRFYVLEHLSWGNVHGHVYGERHRAEAKFNELDGGPCAAMLASMSGEELQYYGARGERIDDFKAWLRQKARLATYYVMTRAASGDVHGYAFKTQGRAEDKFESLSNGDSLATMIANQDFEQLGYAGEDLHLMISYII